jgi:magnesium transporter
MTASPGRAPERVPGAFGTGADPGEPFRRVVQDVIPLVPTTTHTKPVLVDSLRKLLRRGASGNIVNFLGKLRPADVAALFKDLTESEKKSVFTSLSQRHPDRAAQVLREFHTQTGLDILRTVDAPLQAEIVKAMTPDDAAEFLHEMGEEERHTLLEGMQGREGMAIRHLLEYGEETAGRIMTPDYFAMPETATVAQAIAALQSRGAELEVPFYVYVIDARGHLVGVLSLRQLLLGSPDAPLSRVMTTDLVSVTTDMDQEEVARLVSRYDLVAIPVVDTMHRLVGVITIDDVIDVLKEEATEDVYRLAGTSEDERVHRSVFGAVRLRIPWLLASLVGGLVASQVIGRYQDLLTSIVILAGFIPVILGMGGNIGTQCSTIIVRGLATGRIEDREFWWVVFREFRIAVILGLIYGVILGAAAYAMLTVEAPIAVLLGVSLFCSMIIAALIGSSLPMLLKRIGVDPAVATGPFITTSVDVLATLVFFNLAFWLVLK